MGIYDEDSDYTRGLDEKLDAARAHSAEQTNAWNAAAADAKESHMSDGGSPVGDLKAKEEAAAGKQSGMGGGSAIGDLKTKEESGSTSSGGGKHASGETAPFKFSGGGGKHRKGFLSRHKLPIMAGSGGFLIFLLAVLVLTLGSLVIPNFTEHMVAWHFARTGRQLMNSSNTVASQKVSLDSLSDNAFIRQFQQVQRLGNGVGQKINQWRPQKVATAILDGVQYNYTPVYGVNVPGVGTVQRQRLVSMQFPDGTIVDIPQNLNAVGKVTNPYRYVRSYMKFRSDSIGMIASTSKIRDLTVRLKAAKEIRLRIGAKLFRWSRADIDKGKTLTIDEAHVEETKRSYAAASDESRLTNKATEGALGDVEDKATEVVKEQIDCMGEPKCIEEVIAAQDGIAPSVSQNLSKSFLPTPVTSVLGAVSSTYDIAVPVCLIYQASVQKSGPVIDANTDQAMNTAISVGAAADVQKYNSEHPDDPRIDATLYGGLVEQYNGEHGDGSAIANSDAEKFAAGDPIDTSQSPSPQMPPSGVAQYDILQAIGMPGAFSEDVMDPFCEVFASVWTGAGIAGLELIASAIPGIGQAAKVAGATTAKIVSAQIAKQLGKLILKSLSKRELSKLVATGAATTLAAFLAQLITAEHAGMSFNGAAQGDNLVNQPSAGFNALANYTNRNDAMSIPVTTDTLRKLEEPDQDFRTTTVMEKPVSERYFALNNPNSLLNNVAMAAYYRLNLRSASSFVSSTAKLFSPGSLGKLLGTFTPKRAQAAEIISPLHNYYGIVQWAWSPEEEEAYLNNDDYGLFYNQQVLDENADTVASVMETYGKCFDPTVTIGTLLADGDIRRDENANVIADQGLCAPNNLGATGKDNNGNLTFASSDAQWVFRWRVAGRNNNMLDTVLDLQAQVDAKAEAQAAQQ